jgi:sodium/potassium/calcium exchanger 6
MLGGTAERYLTPALAKFASLLKISESLAGVTLLAFGNGAADVIASIAASGMGPLGIYMSTSGLVGSCAANNLFLSPLVVVLSKKAIELPVATYGRDVVFLLVSLTTLLVYFIVGQIYWVMALFFPILYIIYVTVCIIMERRAKKAARENQHHGDRERTYTMAFEEDLAQSQTRAEAIGEEIVRREGDQTFVKYAGVSLTSFLQPSAEEENAHKEPRVLAVPLELAQRLRHRMWGHALRTVVKM